MKAMLIIIVAFLIILYANTYIRYKKRKGNIDTVGEFRKNYLEKEPPKTQKCQDGYRQYITKYNSSMDYIEKDALIDEAAAECRPKQFKPKQFKF